MGDEPIAAFCHRPNADGSFDSICLACFATVYSTQREADLIPGEQRHSCGGWFPLRGEVHHL